MPNAAQTNSTLSAYSNTARHFCSCGRSAAKKRRSVRSTAYPNSTEYTMTPSTAFPKGCPSALPRNAPNRPGFIIQYRTGNSAALNTGRSASSGKRPRLRRMSSSVHAGRRQTIPYSASAAALPKLPESESARRPSPICSNGNAETAVKISGSAASPNCAARQSTPAAARTA